MKNRYYSPQISRVPVCALYHEAKRQRKAMTPVTNQLLAAALEGTTGLTAARARFLMQ